jgi:hypothetical protein
MIKIKSRGPSIRNQGPGCKKIGRWVNSKETRGLLYKITRRRGIGRSWPSDLNSMIEIRPRGRARARAHTNRRARAGSGLGSVVLIG